MNKDEKLDLQMRIYCSGIFLIEESNFSNEVKQSLDIRCIKEHAYLFLNIFAGQEWKK